MLLISKLWHKNPKDVLTQPDVAPEAIGDADSAQASEPQFDIAVEALDVFGPSDETADQISMFGVAQNMPAEPDLPPREISPAEANAEPQEAMGAMPGAEKSAADNAAPAKDASMKPPMCGEQLKMPSCAVNADPVVNFASACAEANISAERPVFNLLSSRIDRDDRLASHPGFKDVRVALARWQNAVHYFESVTNPDLIDFAIYELEAAKRQYVFLLQLAKEDLRREGILASGGA